MNIKMYKNKVDNTFTFKVYRAKKSILLGKSFPSKQACLTGIEQALASIRSNNMINIRSKEGGGGFLFSTNNVESCVFKSLDQASDGLAFLKETLGKKQNFNVVFDTLKKQVISKKKIGKPSEGYDFKQVSKTKKFGFELLDKDSANFYFHFNDKEGKPILFSRSYDGKTARTKAAKNLIVSIKDKTLIAEIITAGNSYVFLLKTAEQEEIGRSKRFRNSALATEALKVFKKDAVGKVKILKLAKKKKKKKKLPKAKYGLNEVAPIGNIGFEAFRSKKYKCHYFQFFDEKAKPLLFSKAFDGRTKRDEAIMEAIELSQDKRLYAISEKKGNYHFVLQNKKGKGIAKSRVFSSKAELIEGMRYFHSNAKSYLNLSNVLSIPSSEQIPININKKKKTPPAPNKVVTKPTNVPPTASKEVPPTKKEASPKGRNEISKKTAPKQQLDNSTNRRKNTPSNQSASTANTKKPQKQTGNKQPQKQNPPSKAKQPRPTQSNNRNTKSNNRNTKTNNRNTNTTNRNTNTTNRNTNKKNRNNPPLKEAQSPKQASTRTKYSKPVVSKSVLNKEDPPRILPRGETEMPQLGFWKWLIPLLLALIVGMWFLRSCGGATEESVSAKPVIEKTVEPIVEKLPTLLGKTATDLGFKKEMVAAKIADFLSLPESVFPATFVLDKVHFASNENQLNREAGAQLDRMASILKAYPNVVVQINGHTDDTGKADINLQLSEERANLVLIYLREKGVMPSKISAKGFGETAPIKTNDTQEGRAANRRSEIVLIKR